VDRIGECDHFVTGRGKVIFPQICVAGKTDPDGVVRRPFGGLAGKHLALNSTNNLAARYGFAALRLCGSPLHRVQAGAILSSRDIMLASAGLLFFWGKK